MGSSMVITLAERVWLMWSIMAASVVVLPDPVGPVTRIMPRGSSARRVTIGGRPNDYVVGADEGTTVTELIERYVREGLACAEHPGIVFKPGPTGRRAALAGGPDVWEIISALRHTHGTERQKVAALATEFAIHERQIGIALNYAAAHREQIEARVRANDTAMDEAERLAAERQRLLA
jgi:hypothetical protein